MVTLYLSLELSVETVIPEEEELDIADYVKQMGSTAERFWNKRKDTFCKFSKEVKKEYLAISTQDF